MELATQIMEHATVLVDTQELIATIVRTVKKLWNLNKTE